MMNTADRVRSTLALILDIEIEPGAEVRREETTAWDSLKHVELIFALEDEFGIQFDEALMTSLNSLTDIVAAVESANAP